MSLYRSVYAADCGPMISRDAECETSHRFPHLLTSFKLEDTGRPEATNLEKLVDPEVPVHGQCICHSASWYFGSWSISIT